MNPLHLSARLSCAAFVLAVAARAEEAPATLKFSDPSKPGRLEIKAGQGSIRVQGADDGQITVKAEARPVAKSPRKDGLRVISSSSSFVLSEKDNVAVLDAMTDGWKSGVGSGLAVTVPRHTAVVIRNSWGGDVTCAGLAGNLEINCLNGVIKLDDITGGVVASTMNGEIRATIRELREGSPLSFTSMNGEVLLRLPESAKASVRLRTQNGSVLTDFDEAALVTKSESSPVPGRRIGTARSGSGNKIVSEDVHVAIREAVREGASVAREVINAVKESIEAAREGAEAAREAARAEAEAARERAQASNAPVPPAAPAAPAKPAVAPKPGTWPAAPKIPAIPTITGGKLVTGTLNGGGPEISVATMNGDVVLRKL